MQAIAHTKLVQVAFIALLAWPQIASSQSGVGGFSGLDGGGYSFGPRGFDDFDGNTLSTPSDQFRPPYSIFEPAFPGTPNRNETLGLDPYSTDPFTLEDFTQPDVQNNPRVTDSIVTQQRGAVSRQRQVAIEELLNSQDARTLLSVEPDIMIDLGDTNAAEAIVDLYGMGLPYGEIVEKIPEDDLKQSILEQYLSLTDPKAFAFPDPDMTMQQVATGTPIEGEGGPKVCSSPACGTNLIVGPGTGVGGGGGGFAGPTIDTSTLETVADSSGHVGPKCPALICPDANKEVAGCAGELCYFPPLQPLPDEDDDGRTDLVYRQAGYPEVVFLMKRYKDIESKIPNCSATALADRWLITALHCLATDSTMLASHYSEHSFSEPGWTKLTVGQDSSLLGIDVIVTAPGQVSTTVAAAYVNYGSLSEVTFSTNGTPTRDFAILELGGQALSLGDFSYPLIRTDYSLPKGAISFSGFGWTNVALSRSSAFPLLTLEQKWAAMKQAAFNFIESFTPDDFHDNSVIKWKQGDPEGTGGPCLFDSGGPVYAGFNRGFWNSPRQVIGVVSGLRGADGVDTGDDCLGDGIFAVAEHISHFSQGVCAITGSAPRGCKN